MTHASLRTFLERISAHINRRFVTYLVIFSAIYFIRATAEAAARPLWNDELFTAYLLRVPSGVDLWNGLASGVDLTPPLYHVILRVLEPWFGGGPIVLRLPSLVGFWVMCLCLYRFVACRLPAEFGFAALLLPLCTNASQYMTEARPYGLMLGAGGLALVSWQALEARSRLRLVWLALLAVCLTAAIATHYYAVLLVLPLAAGEIARSIRRGSADWAVWSSLALPLLVLAPLLPLIRVAREFAPTFWTRARIGETALVYNNWLAHSDWVLVALVAMMALAAWLERPSDGGRLASPPAADLVAASVFLALPAIGGLVAYVTSSGFMWRYVLPGIIGFAILGSYALARAFGHSPGLRLAMLLVLALNHETVFETRDLLAAAEPSPIRASIQREVLELEDADSPVLVSSPHGFLELYYYAPSQLARRLRYVTSQEIATREVGSDTADRGLMLLAKAVPLPVGSYPDDLPSVDYYIVDTEPLNWLVRDLVRRQGSLAVIAAGDGFSIFRVSHHDGAR